MLLSALISALNGAIAKILSQELSALEIVFFRNVLGVLFLLVMLKHTPTRLPGGKTHLLILRGLLGFSAMILFFYTITTIPLGVAITLNKTSPLFVTILAFFLLKEHLSVKALFALIVGFIGVLMITKPVGLTLGYEHFLGILGGFLAAAAYTTIKKIKHIYDARVIVLSFMTTGSVIPLLLFLIAPFVQAPEAIAFLFVDFHLPTTLKIWTLILLIGIISTLSQWLLTKAYSLSNAGIIGIVSYTNIPFAIGFGYMLGDAFPDFWTFCGIGLIVLGGLLVKKG
ncbi:DMT family transporter [bacterium]|jgi:drug/metabolite transporter (DMT)-like permease|nr:DMT family transporter [bacterium]